MKNKTTSILLMIGSIIWIINILYGVTVSIVEDYFTFNIVGNTLYLLMIIVPISLLILSINLNKLSTINHEEIKPHNNLKTELTIGDWLFNIF
jgi:hypothetical protein